MSSATQTGSIIGLFSHVYAFHALSIETCFSVDNGIGYNQVLLANKMPCTCMSVVTRLISCQCQQGPLCDQYTLLSRLRYKDNSYSAFINIDTLVITLHNRALEWTHCGGSRAMAGSGKGMLSLCIAALLWRAISCSIYSTVIRQVLWTQH